MTHIHADLGQASLRPGRRRPNAAPLPGAHLRTRYVQRRQRRPSFRRLELDTAESARLWHVGRRADPAGVSVVIGFSLPTGEAVDERYAELTSAGHAGRQPPFDAFWGPGGRSWPIPTAMTSN